MAVGVESTAARKAKRRMLYHEADVVVVGAGVFGCAAAYALASQGRSVLLLERWMYEPDRIVGELLQPGGVAALRRLGLERCLEGIDAIPCYGYHVLYHGDDVVMKYPGVDGTGSVTPVVERNINGEEYMARQMNGFHSNGSAKASTGPEKQSRRAEGRSFHHGRFIMKLREACQAHPNITVFETEVTATIRGEHSTQILGVESLTTDRETKKKESDYFFGQLTVIADGYASKFREQLVGRKPEVRSKFYALELIDCPFLPNGFGHVVIGNASPILLYQIGTHETRALFDVPIDLPAASAQRGGVRGYIRDVALPTLPASVRPSVLAALADGRIPKSMPNSYLSPSPQSQHSGVVLLGDAMNMRHPLTGGGMTVALNDVLLLSDLLAPERVPDLGDAAAVQAAMTEFHWRRKSLTAIINVLAQALYSLFAAHDDRQLLALQRGCFEYFSRGYTDEPLGMMSGLIRQPMMLASHFFTVAFLAIYLNALDVCGGSIFGLLKLPLALIDAVLILWRASVVFLPVCWTELRY
jgi:squalene monooxygenase